MRTISVTATASRTHASPAEAIQSAKHRDFQFWERHRKEDILDQRVCGVSFDEKTFQFELNSGAKWQVSATGQGQVSLSEAPTQSLASVDPIVLLQWATIEPSEWNRHAAAQKLLSLKIRNLFYNDQLCLYGEEGELLYFSELMVAPSNSPMLY